MYIAIVIHNIMLQILSYVSYKVNIYFEYDQIYLLQLEFFIVDVHWLSVAVFSFLPDIFEELKDSSGNDDH